MPKGQVDSRAQQLLMQLVPLHVFKEARELAKRIEREERFKEYLLRYFWLIFPGGLMLFAVCAACVLLAFCLLHTAINAGRFWIAIAAIGLVPLAIGGFLYPLYLLFAWLERKAIREDYYSKARETDYGRGGKNTSRVLIALLVVPVTVFIVIPAISFVLFSAQGLVASVSFGLIAMLIYTMIEK